MTIRLSPGNDEMCSECGHGLHASHSVVGCTDPIPLNNGWDRILFSATPGGNYHRDQLAPGVCLCPVQWQPLIGAPEGL